MKIRKLPKKVVGSIERVSSDIAKISRLVNDRNLSRSYYESEKRKSKAAVYTDLLLWWLRYREVNTFYYFYGLDRKYGARTNDYLPYKQFRRIRDQRNQRPQAGTKHNYICLLRDKFVFSQFVSSLGFPTPRNLALCDCTSITWLDHRGQAPLETLVHDQTLELDTFCKSLTGMGGSGVFPLNISGGKIFSNGYELTLDQLKAMLQGVYLLQQPIQQHPTMSSLHPQSINAIRLVTFNNGGTVEAFWAALKVGCGGNRVDNVACGGLAVRIDLATGRLVGNGMFLPNHGTCVDQHPDTGLHFDGFEIPYFHEAVQCAIDLHRHLYAIHSIGWDIAITQAGPMFIEGNDDWAGHFAQAFVPNFKSRFLEMYH